MSACGGKADMVLMAFRTRAGLWNAWPGRGGRVVGSAAGIADPALASITDGGAKAPPTLAFAAISRLLLRDPP